MARKNKKQQALSESSDEGLVDGITNPHGPAARVGPIQVATSRVLVPKEVQVQWPPVIHPLNKKTSPTGHQSLFIDQPVNIQMITS